MSQRKWLCVKHNGSIPILALACAFLSVSSVVRAASVEPEYVAGNPSCESLGYDFGFKVDPPNSGTYNIDGINSVTVTTDGVYFDWTSTLGIDAVIAKGGPNANVYKYNPESFGDTGLHSPINPSNGNPFGLSHIEFCYDYDLTVSKTAETTFTRTWVWDIEKSVTPDVLDLFKGDSGLSDYTVEVTKTGYTDSAWAVSGSITIENNTPIDATVSSVTDVISDGLNASVDCGDPLPIEVDSGDSLVCSYSRSLPDGANRTNTATVTTTGAIDGGTATAPVIFGDPTTVVNDTINVTDSVEGDLGSASDDKTFEYSRTFTCDEDEGDHPNTATIVETGQSDNAEVTVNCYDLTVTKDADTSLVRRWLWTIDKSVDQPTLILAPGQSIVVNYSVIVGLQEPSYTDSDWAVSGNITVANPAPIDATINSVSDVISGGINATVDCGETFPYLLPAGESLECTYSATLPDDDTRTNTATATLQNNPSGTTDFSGSVDVIFDDDTTVSDSDECASVSDTYAGDLGTVCKDEAPKTFTYTRTIGPYTLDACAEGDNLPNTAAFTANDTGTTGSDSAEVVVDVTSEECGGGDDGCTLTQGYWKTHSDRGPAPYDPNWGAIGPLEEETPFFLSGKTWYQVLWTAPVGNVYYVLAHQYIAAKLNILNGASSTTAVDAAIAWAEAFFAVYTPTSNLTNVQRKHVLANTLILDNYNNGIIGPGHCSE